jgi:hypothetical protein
MNADAFRHFYRYHFAQNRTIWDAYIRPLSFEQFTQDVSYSHGSVRSQLIHVMNADDTWFSALRGAGLAEPYTPATFDDRKLIRANWDELEQNMGDYLSNLSDDMLFQKPFSEGEDKTLSCGRYSCTWLIMAPTTAPRFSGYCMIWELKPGLRITFSTYTTIRRWFISPRKFSPDLFLT